MKILLVTKEWGFGGGGIEQYLIDLSKSLPELGHHCSILYSKKGPRSLEYRPLLDKEYILPALDENPNGHDWEGIRNVMKIISDVKPDIIYLNRLRNYRILQTLAEIKSTIPRLHWPELTCLRNGTKTFYFSRKVCNRRVGFGCYLRGCIIRKPDEGRIWPKFPNLIEVRRRLDAYRRFNKILVATNFMKREMLTHGFSEEQLILLPHNTAKFPVIDSSRMNYEKKIVLFVGRITRYKGVDFLLRTAAHLKGNFTIWIVGEGSHFKRYKKLARKLGLESKVKFWGLIPNEELYKLYLETTLVVIPSAWAEDSPRVGIEAGAWAKPVVAFNVGGIPDMVENGKNGFLIPPKDIEELAQKVDLLLSNSDLARRLGMARRVDVEMKFGRKRYLNSLISIFKEVTKTKNIIRDNSDKIVAGGA